MKPHNLRDPFAVTTAESAREPWWVSIVLRPFPAPIFAFAGIVGCLTAIAGCAALYWFAWSLFASAFCAFFLVAAGLIGVASVVRRRRERLGGDNPPGRYANSQRAPTFAIVALLVSIFSWHLCLGIHVFDVFFAANRPGGVKYLVTVGLATTSTAYVLFHGRHVIRRHFGEAPGRNVWVTPGQAASVVLLGLSFSAYFVWLLI